MNPTALLSQYLLKKAYQNYLIQVEDLTTPYEHWIEENEKDRDPVDGSFFEFMSFSDFTDRIRSGNIDFSRKFICIADSQGTAAFPEKKWKRAFEEKVALAYADEDLMDEKSGRRYGAWFKPGESPDTLLSFFYYGSILFLNTEFLKSVFPEYRPSFDLSSCSDRQCLYDFIAFFSEKIQGTDYEICHIPQVLFHGKGSDYKEEDPKKPEVVNTGAYWGFESEYDALKLAAAKRRVEYAQECITHLEPKIREIRRESGIYHVPCYDIRGEKPMVSVVIPSKDHPEVLGRCVESFCRLTEYPNYEFVVVDNGSSSENRAAVEQLADRVRSQGHSFSYLYEPMEFNFSKMCNLGVEKTHGALLLLLNDDMEIVDPAWLSVLAGQALCPWVGAVGAKLLYPDSDLIQHVGISNLPVGPAHKLLKEHDAIDYYYGRNVLPYDMVGVTAACLMVEKEKYLRAGGLPEEISISYNDVGLNFGLQEIGCNNIIRNDVICFHHESLSRGDDRMDEEKWNRLLQEKDVLYRMHPGFKGVDPYYTGNLAGFKHKYFCSYLYPYERRNSFSALRPFRKQIKEEWHNNCLVLNLEHVRLERKLDLEEERDVYWIEGWSYVLGMDNCRYKRTLLLTDEKGVTREVEMWNRYRGDVVDILPEQTNVALAGFSARIRMEQLSEGNYTLSMLYSDRCSRQKLYKECETKVEIKR